MQGSLSNGVLVTGEGERTEIIGHEIPEVQRAVHLAYVKLLVVIRATRSRDLAPDRSV